MLLFALLACTPAPTPGGDTDVVDITHRRDDALTIADLQALGTHNSYHVETTELPAWNYTHAPLDVQLGVQGVRQFELDLWRDDPGAPWQVHHILTVDEGTTCPALRDCVLDLADWSADHPGHHPLFVLLEPKAGVPSDPALAAQWLADAEADLVSPHRADWLITPSEVQGDWENLNLALGNDGWPTLGALRGRVLFVWHDGGAWRDVVLANLLTTTVFPDAQGDYLAPYAAVHTMNNAFDPNIPLVVGYGQLVRTRADSDTAQAQAGDYSTADAAIASGAHFISTDFPVPFDKNGYVVRIPGGTPSRCNPARDVPEDCLSTDIEDPTKL